MGVVEAHPHAGARGADDGGALQQEGGQPPRRELAPVAPQAAGVGIRLARRLHVGEAGEGGVEARVDRLDAAEAALKVGPVAGHRVHAVAGMVAHAQVGLVVDVPVHDRPVAAKTACALPHQFVAALPVGGVVDAGARPQVVVRPLRVGTAAAIHHLGVGMLLEEGVADVEGGEPEQHAHLQFRAKVQQPAHLVDVAVEADADADGVEPGVLDHRQVAPPVLLAARQPLGARRHAPERVLVVGAEYHPLMPVVTTPWM